jgi:hypothetical protein
MFAPSHWPVSSFLRILLWSTVQDRPFTFQVLVVLLSPQQVKRKRLQYSSAKNRKNESGKKKTPSKMAVSLRVNTQQEIKHSWKTKYLSVATTHFLKE